MAYVKVPGLQPDQASSEIEWSHAQRLIFDWFAHGMGNLIVRARAGCAKTTTALEAINYAPESKILLAAFNKSIADELASRLTNACARARTLHSVGYSFCAKNVANLSVENYRAENLAKQACAEIAKGSTKTKPCLEATQIVRELHTKLREIVVDPKLRWGSSLPQKLGEFAGQYDIDLDGADMNHWSRGQIMDATLLALDLALQPTSVIDYADMIYLPLRMQWVRPIYGLMVVDEAQDMNQGQIDLALRITKKGGRICVIGDDRQAIYGFRGAATDSLDTLKSQLQAEELKLTTTYRCGTRIVDLAQTFVPDFQAGPTNPPGRIYDNATLANVAPGDFILARTNAALVRPWFECIHQGIPARINNLELGERLFKLLTRFKGTPFERLDDAVVLWQKAEIAKLEANTKLSPASRLEKANSIAERAETLRAFISGVGSWEMLETNISRSFSKASDVKVVQCMTVHKAKGLEAKNVYLCTRTFLAGKSTAEDNICYVAITRAKERLYLLDGMRQDFQRIDNDADDVDRSYPLPTVDEVLWCSRFGK